METLWRVTSIILVNDWFIKFYRKTKRGFLRCETKNPASTHESANDNKLWLLPSEEFLDLICPPIRWHSPSVMFKSLVCLDHEHALHQRLTHPKLVNFSFISTNLKKYGNDSILCPVVTSAAWLYPGWVWKRLILNMSYLQCERLKLTIYNVSWRYMGVMLWRGFVILTKSYKM